MADIRCAYPDTLVGTDSHTTMVNGLAVLGWGVGGIEAEAAMLGQPISMLIPEVVGFRLTGELKDGVTATDLVLTVTQMLRENGVVGKFVEFYGAGPRQSAARGPRHHRQHGAGIRRDLRLLPDRRGDARLSRGDRRARTSASRWSRPMPRRKACSAPPRRPTRYSPRCSQLDLGDVEPSIAGPKRPQDRVPLAKAAAAFAEALDKEYGKAAEAGKRVPVQGKNFDLGHGDVVIAAITSCTNTSNPFVMMAAGLLAKKALKKGLSVKPWVKTSLAPGSQVVTDYLDKAGLQKDLDALGFNLVGYGCTTCIGNSGPLPEAISKAIHEQRSGGRLGAVGQPQFRGPGQSDVRANYLASPPLVVAYALAGSMAIDLATEPLGTGTDGEPVYLKDIWPSAKEIAEVVRKAVKTIDVPEALRRRVHGRSRMARDRGQRRAHLWLGRGLDLCAEPALFHRHDADAGAGDRCRRRAHPRPVPRLHHHRPHLAGRLASSATARPGAI